MRPAHFHEIERLQRLKAACEEDLAADDMAYCEATALQRHIAEYQRRIDALRAGQPDYNTPLAYKD